MCSLGAVLDLAQLSRADRPATTSDGGVHSSRCLVAVDAVQLDFPSTGVEGHLKRQHLVALLAVLDRPASGLRPAGLGCGLAGVVGLGGGRSATVRQPLLLAGQNPPGVVAASSRPTAAVFASGNEPQEGRHQERHGKQCRLALHELLYHRATPFQSEPVIPMADDSLYFYIKLIFCQV